MKIVKLMFSKAFDDEPIKGTKAEEWAVRIIVIAFYVIAIGQVVRYDLILKHIINLIELPFLSIKWSYLYAKGFQILSSFLAR